ncbi:hypothetical protein C0Q85_26600 [Klebsiella pneumoniae]|nr:hypothetical protein C0Q85_26600 [Klebsiella pneumoniae]
MMDFKDEDNRNHQRAINRFSELAIDKVGRLVIRGGGGRFVESPFSIAIVPSHTSGRISPALIEVAERVVRTYRRGNVGNDSNLLVVFYVQIMSNDFVMQFSLQA